MRNTSLSAIRALSSPRTSLELAGLLGITQRSAQRAIQALRAAGVPLQFEAGRYCVPPEALAGWVTGTA